jgi:Fic family protein
MYDSPHQFEPLWPTDRQLAEIQPQTERIVAASLRLTAAAHETTRSALRELVRSMNSYYSNRIEGLGTHPRNIERALANKFSQRPDIARLQRIAKAHIEAEKELEMHSGGPAALRSAFLTSAHIALYSRLAEEDRASDEGTVVIPGQLRTQNVEVGRHVPPDAASLPRFLDRLDAVYGQVQSWDRLLIATACLHHRVAWVHPFLDGNGRTTRLQSHCALWTLSGGLWSPSRGLARTVADYYAYLQSADAPRRGDLDGRGNLSAAGLLDWIRYFLEVCEDQVNYMTRMLALDQVKQRIEAFVTFRAAHDKAMRSQAILPLYHTFAAGPLTRAEFSQMTGLGERTARSLLSKLLSEKLLVSDTPLGPVRFGLPLDALQFLLPQLYPEVNLPEE